EPVENVVIKPVTVNEKRALAAYYTIKPAHSIEADGLKKYLHQRLPAYMVPEYYVALEEFPLTINGKIDRKQLPDPALKQEGYVPPRNSVEQALAGIWSQLLQVKRVGIYDDFFELGGHSLLATRVISAIRHEMKVELAIKHLFDHPTIAALASCMNEMETAALLPAIEAGERPERIPLSFAQERLWFIHELNGSIQYHLPVVMRLKGSLNIAALSSALQGIINRHEVLRTVIRQHEGAAYQQLLEKDSWQLNIVEGGKYRKKAAALQELVRQMISYPFDLGNDHMLRADLVRLNQHDHILVVVLHHIASDGWSMSVIVKELVELYNAYNDNRAPQLPLLPVQYADYALWQRKYLTAGRLERSIAYWKVKLKDVDPLQLPTDHARPAVQSTDGSAILFNINRNLTEQLKILSARQGATLYMTLLSALKVLLYRYSGQQDICVGSPIAGRTQKETEGLIGFFINTLALRSNIHDECSFTDLLAQVKTTTLEAYEHQDVPFEKVVEAVAGHRDLSRNPLFQVLFTLQNVPDIPELQLGKAVLKKEELEHTASMFDLNVSITEMGDELNVLLAYCTDLFEKDTIVRMSAHFKELLWSVVQLPEQAVSKFNMISEEEYSQLEAFNRTESAYPSDKTVTALFEEQAERTPLATAVLFGEKVTTYKELNERSNQLGHYLRRHGVREGQLVAICLDRSSEMMIAVLGILKAGAAYVPVDPGYPADRIAFMLEDTAARVIISGSAQVLPENISASVVLIDEHWPLIDRELPDKPFVVNSPRDLVYVIYTSGSTGRPKGVMIEHHSLVNYLLNSKTNYLTANRQRAGNFLHLSYSFDAAVTGIFMPLLSGRSVVMGTAKGIDIFEESVFVSQAPYDFIKLTPGHLELLKPKVLAAEATLASNIVLGGEALLWEQVEYLLEAGGYEIINEYGPTEATVGCSTYSFNRKTTAGRAPGVPIGKPIDNVRMYILDRQMQLSPVGVPGEIYIGGAGLARGYLNLDELTRQKFIPDPFSKGGGRLYRTGDLGRWLADGNIEYLGRIDEQVKIRGYRVEPGEIESVIRQTGLAHNAVVVARQLQHEKSLVAYVVPAAGYERERLMEQLKLKLPAYMIPALAELKSMPLNAHGKIDKKLLPEPGMISVSGHAAPGSELEKVLAGIWQHLLQIEHAGIYDNFFEIGGHSLLAMRVAA
ncbi:MAG TPA: amino acid adenylation domain-containing protein, partial [Chitinophagaceae bacterium]|nr:amino acid adenylation domain-containing protein [Chitinophagaceae bacterium]